MCWRWCWLLNLKDSVCDGGARTLQALGGQEEDGLRVMHAMTRVEIPEGMVSLLALLLAPESYGKLTTRPKSSEDLPSCCVVPSDSDRWHSAPHLYSEI